METKVKPTVETWLCRGYLFLMLALLPLAVHNGFFDITETKTICFTVPTVVFVLVRLGFTLYRENGLPRCRLAGAEWAALAFCLICFIASAAGGDFAGAFLGERGRYQGLGMMWLYAALYFAFSGARVRSGDVLVPLGLGLFLSGALTVCNHLGYDVLGFCSQLGEFDRGRYISTLGNINFAGAYLTLVWPVCAAALLTERRLWKGILLGIVCVTGLWAAMAVRSESAVLGIGAALALLPLLAKKEPDALRRYPLLLAGTALSVLAYRAIVYDFGKRLSSLGRHFSEPAVMLPLAVLGAAAYFLLRKRENKTLLLVRKIYAYILLGAAVLAAVVLVLLNTVWSAVPAAWTIGCTFRIPGAPTVSGYGNTASRSSAISRSEKSSSAAAAACSRRSMCSTGISRTPFSMPRTANISSSCSTGACSVWGRILRGSFWRCAARGKRAARSPSLSRRGFSATACRLSSTLRRRPVFRSFSCCLPFFADKMTRRN